ncbi:cache domain-containing sensor histidine kinase [Paenibacillus donghaensis]|uniref:histidine kinase n=1 Tax=Paenibacillus donghaensis TaxID=414771 RepID=A0A2Z2KBR7_9BACL|nr:sensor histidine kinase [Paenibacillus donghaensis]ASA23007.1 two-component sensor histidine kinase [Paenibacillus donghaensis]
MLKKIRELAPKSIRHKLIIASITCILVPAVLTLFIYNSLTQEAVKQQAVANAEDSLTLVGGSVANRLKGMLTIANFVQVNPSLKAYFKLVASGNEVGDKYQRFMDSSRVLDQLDSLTVVGETSYVTILLTNDTYFMNYSVSDYNPLDLKKKPWFGKLTELTGLESYWIGVEETDFAYDKFDHPYQVTIARTLRRDDAEIYGYVVMTIMEDQLHNIFSNLSAGQKVVLLDQFDTIVSGGDPASVGKPFPYADVTNKLKSTTTVSIDGDKYLVAQQQIGFSGWRLVLMQPYKQSIVNISSIFNRVFTIQLISFVVFLALLITLVRTFTKPLVRLGKVTSAVQRGNLHVRSGVRGNDEIGRLGFLFDQMLDRVKEMLAEVSDTQARKRKAELKMLQAQINPHFLFNVLNSIRMKVMKRGDPESAKMIGSLSMLLRMTISREEDEIFLHEEIDLVSHYVGLMNLRQKEEARLLLDIEPDAFLIRVPRFFLQPLVENALIHGLSQHQGQISITAVLQEHYLLLTVEDNGQGMDEEGLKRIGRKIESTESLASAPEEGRSSFSGMGLHNTVERMRMTFGEFFEIKVNSQPGSGTVIEMHIPLKEENRDV